MSSSLIKANYVNIGKDGKRVIDSNQAISDRLQFLSEILETDLSGADFGDGFTEGLEAQDVSALFSDSEDGFENADAVIATEPAVSSEDIDNMLREANEEAQRIIDDANATAEDIINGAGKEAESIKQDAFETGKQEGYNAGYEEGLARTKAIEEELNEKIRMVDVQYEEKIAELEPRFIELLTDIYTHIFNVDFSDKSELILSLIHNAIRNIDGGHNFFVHVSKDDYEYVNENRDMLLKGLPSTCSVEVIEDMSLSQSNCFVEAESGIFDCSLDIELNNLSKQLRLLSYGSE